MFPELRSEDGKFFKEEGTVALVDNVKLGRIRYFFDGLDDIFIFVVVADKHNLFEI